MSQKTLEQMIAEKRYLQNRFRDLNHSKIMIRSGIRALTSVKKRETWSKSVVNIHVQPRKEEDVQEGNLLCGLFYPCEEERRPCRPGFGV